MLSIKFRRFIWSFHRIVSYIIGIQIVLWIAGGVIMSWYDLRVVRGEHNIAIHEMPILPPVAELVPIDQVLGNFDGLAMTGSNLGFLGDKAVYRLEFAGGDPAIVDAVSGEILTPLSEAMALSLALRDFAGDGSPDGAQWLTEPNMEYRNVVPVWRVDMMDVEDTHLYVSPMSGNIISRRNDTWRLFDFFWMLHIMDYEDRTDFNNPLLVWTSILAFLFASSGMVLIYYRVKR
jgi:hypothetical protein